MNKKTTEITTQPNIVMPAVSPQEAVDAWKAYQALKREIATSDDIQTIQGKEFFKKSYWRKMATFFNLSVEIVEEQKEELDNNVVYHFTQKAIAPNGRFAYGVGSCDLLEKGRRNTIHNARGTAETRAFNRAVSNLIGGGEVSAEEIVEDAHIITPHSETHAVTAYPQKTDENGNGTISFKQIKYISVLLKEKGYTEKQLMHKYDITDMGQLTREQASNIIESLEKLPNPIEQEEVVLSDEDQEAIEKMM